MIFLKLTIALLSFVKILDFTYLFQIKEYRLDRFLSLIKEEGILKTFLLRTPRLPAKSPRNTLIVIVTTIIVFQFISLIKYVPLLILNLTTFPLISFLGVITTVLLTELVAQRHRKNIIRKANDKIKKSHAVFIGIAGSYGKTSIKEFLYHLLSAKYKVAKTENNQNSEVGIALSVLKNLSDDTQFFITEMGAYRPGDIKAICDFTKPVYGILNAIGNQHLDLFGSRKNIIKTKSELLYSLPTNGKAYVNKDIPEYKEILKDIKCKSYLYSSTQNADIYASDISLENDSIHADIHRKNDDFKIKVKLLGKHNISNLLPCIALALDLGLTKQEILERLETIDQSSHKLSLYKGIKSVAVLKDSNNSNLEGFIAAIKTADSLSYKNKIIVSKGIIELGKEKESSYKKIIDELNQSSLNLYTTDHLFKKLDRKNNVQIFKDENNMRSKLVSQLNSDTLVVIEGKFKNFKL